MPRMKNQSEFSSSFHRQFHQSKRTNDPDMSFRCRPKPSQKSAPSWPKNVTQIALPHTKNLSPKMAIRMRKIYAHNSLNFTTPVLSAPHASKHGKSSPEIGLNLSKPSRTTTETCTRGAQKSVHENHPSCRKITHIFFACLGSKINPNFLHLFSDNFTNSRGE